MTSVLEDVDLSWVTFADKDEERKCDRATKDCPNVAVWRLHWFQHCGCQSKLPKWYCDACYRKLSNRPGEVYAICNFFLHAWRAKVSPLGRT